MTDTTTKRAKKRAPRGGGSVFKRGGVYWLAFKDNDGERRQISTGKRVLAEALAHRDQVFAELHLGTFVVGAAKVTLAHIKGAVLADHDANGLRSRKRAEQAFANLERILGAETPHDRVGRAVDRYVQTRLGEAVGTKNTKAAPGTVNRELSYLRRGYKLLLRRRSIATAPHIELLKEDNVRTRVPSDAELASVIAELPERLRDAVIFAAATGWRAREVLRLQWRNVDEEAGNIRLEGHETKSGKPRTLPYAKDPRLAELLAERRRATSEWDRTHLTVTPWVFWYAGTGADGQPAALPNRAYNRAWNAACRRAGVADLKLHDLRRHYARTANRAGVDEKTIMALAGWATRGVFDRYSIRNTEDLEDGVAKLARAAQERASARRSRLA